MNTTNNIEKEVTKKILGYTEEITTCDCCGKNNLKGTFAIEFNENLAYFGSVCAFKLHGVEYIEQKEVKKEFKARIKSTDKLNLMLNEYNGTRYSMDKIIKFAESKKIETKEIILKFGVVIDEMNFATYYSIGNLVRLIEK